MAARLYGPILRTAVSRVEQCAACPFRVDVHSGLRAEERQRFETDVKEQGSFQHEILAAFHKELADAHKHWRDITPKDARAAVARIATQWMALYRDGLFLSTEQGRFTARVLTESLQDFVETLVEWMREQYEFDPVCVELPFGADGEASAWILELGKDQKLALHGRIDRVDLWRRIGSDEALCVVVDYKSSDKSVDSLLMAHGIQLQLPAYLAVLRNCPKPHSLFDVERLIPAGVFYVNLRGNYESEANRATALEDPVAARKRAFPHTGRFDARALPHLDRRPGVRKGDQFNYRLTKDGRISGNCREAMSTEAFEFMLDSVESTLKKIGRDIFSGAAQVSPFRKGKLVACNDCLYQEICRVDPWSNPYRILRKEKAPAQLTND